MAAGAIGSPQILMLDPAYRDHLETMFLDKGLRVIGAIYNSPTVILTKKPAPKIEDIKGMKVRTFASPLQMEPMKSIGAIPTPLAPWSRAAAMTMRPSPDPRS